MGSLVWGILLENCLSLSPFVPRFSAGVMRRSSLHTLVLGVLWPPSASGSGGRPWPMTFAVSLSLALSAPSPSLVIPLPLGCFALSLFHLVLGRTDFVTDLPPSAGNSVVLTVVDRFSKTAHFIPLPKLPAAKETALAIFDHVFRVHGLPTDIVSDRGPQFVSQFWREFCRQIGATVSLSSGFHPQTNGQAERVNQILGRLLRTLAAHKPSSWCEQLGWAEYAYNSLPSSSTGISPFHCCLGYQPPLFSAQESESSVPSVQALIKRCQLTWKRVRKTLYSALH